MSQTLNNHDICGRDIAVRDSVFAAIKAALAGAGDVLYFSESGQWGIKWQNCPKDPFSGEQPITTYTTAGEALNAAISMHE